MVHYVSIQAFACCSKNCHVIGFKYISTSFLGEFVPETCAYSKQFSLQQKLTMCWWISVGLTFLDDSVFLLKVFALDNLWTFCA
jgi:hypothetical protein